MRNLILAATAVILFCLHAPAQKRVVVLGSSTVAGNGASILDSCWVERLQKNFRKNMSDGADTIIERRGYPGYVTYHGLPSDYVMPANRLTWPPDPERNVTWILNQFPRPDIVILSYPSNDVNLPDYNMKETMDNLRLMFQQYNANGIRCFISTSQPRNDTWEYEKRVMLKQLADSVKNNFGYYAINFWDDLVTNDGQYQLKAEVNADNIHPNNLGHRLLYQRVLSKNIFSLGSTLPLSLLDFQVKFQNNSTLILWKTANEEANSYFEIQRSKDGRDFITLTSKSAIGQTSYYNFSDTSSLPGKSFYRLKIVEPSKTSYSKIIAVVTNQKQVTIAHLYADASTLHAQINSNNRQSVVLSIVSYSGTILQKKSVILLSSNNDVVLSISNLAAGDYILNMTSSDGIKESQRFSKLK